LRNLLRFDDRQWLGPNAAVVVLMWLSATAVSLNGLRFRPPVPQAVIDILEITVCLAALVAAIALARHWRLTGKYSLRLSFLMLSLMLAAILVAAGVSATA
jgi:hypothetical protein